jgi:phosphoribosylformimino-5-aminoimidazole carboxamide ribotide isomerase
VLLIPAIDILGGVAVRLLRGNYADVTVYSGDPVALASGFVADGADLIHVVDLDAARGGPRDRNVPAALGAAGIPFQIGGGIRTASQADGAIREGAFRVVIGSVLVSAPDEAREIVRAVGPTRVVAAIDVRAGHARGSGWTDAGTPLHQVVERVTSLGIAMALVTGIDRDGTLEGPDIALLGEVRALAPDLSLIASGGVGTLGDLVALASSPIEPHGAVVGKALYEGRFTLGEAHAALR